VKLEALFEAQRGAVPVVVPLRTSKVTAKSAGGDLRLKGVSAAELSEMMRKEMVGRDGIEPPTHQDFQSSARLRSPRRFAEFPRGFSCLRAGSCWLVTGNARACGHTDGHIERPTASKKSAGGRVAFILRGSVHRVSARASRSLPWGRFGGAARSSGARCRSSRSEIYQSVSESTKSCLRSPSSTGRGDSLITRCWGSAPLASAAASAAE
jgi:hypothetical protein